MPLVMDVEEPLKCIICLDLANEAVESLCDCHLIVCEDHARQLAKCPTCQTSPFKCQPSFICRRQIRALPVNCDFCNLKVRRDDLEAHRKNCEKRPKKCNFDGCSFWGLEREALLAHLTESHGESIEKNFEEFTSSISRLRRHQELEDENAALRAHINEMGGIAEGISSTCPSLSPGSGSSSSSLGRLVSVVGAERPEWLRAIEESRKKLVAAKGEFERLKKEMNSNSASNGTGLVPHQPRIMFSVPGMWSSAGSRIVSGFEKASVGIEVTSDRKRARQIAPSKDRPRLVAMTGRIYGQGIERLKVRLNGTDLYAGVALCTVPLENLFENKDAWVMYQRAQAVVLRSNRTVPDRPDIPRGAVLTVELDATRRTVTFNVDNMSPGEPLLLGIGDEMYKNLCFAVQLRNNGDSIEII